MTIPCTAMPAPDATAADATDAAPPPAAPADTETWPVIGTQGLVQFVIVPQAHATDGAAYERQIARLCPPQQTCFVNFYTNSTGAPATLPLSDAIAAESTAIYRISMKAGLQMFRWSCRTGVSPQDCY